MNRHEFITARLCRDDRILEIGPLNNPAARKDCFPQVSYADIRSTQEVKDLYGGNDYLQTTGLHVDTGAIVDIDYVLRDSYRATFRNAEKFDALIACHVMEHVPDIIGFFQDIASILKPHAKVLIAYPDRRYCFDHFRTDVSFRDAYDVYRNGPDRLAGLAMDFLYSAIDENDPEKFWTDASIATLLPNKSFDAAKKQYEKCQNGAVADDAHYWIFSDYAFAHFLYDCVRAGLCPFTCTDFIATQPNTQEFYVALSYEPEVVDNPGAALARLKRIYATLAAPLEAELLAARDALNKLEASKSWRLTAPLRRITEFFRARQ